MLLLIALAGTLASVSDGPAAAKSSARSAVAVAPTAIAPTAPQRSWHSIVLHHSATRAGSVQSIDAVHRRQTDSTGKHWLGIGYHFVVGNGNPMSDGEVQSTFRWHQQLPGAHAGTRDYNQHGIGVCLIGNFDQHSPTARQMMALTGLVKSLSTQFGIPRERVLGHRDVHATACPGRLFPIEQLLADVFATSEGT
jgi:hypothetical protein